MLVGLSMFYVIVYLSWGTVHLLRATGVRDISKGDGASAHPRSSFRSSLDWVSALSRQHPSAGYLFQVCVYYFRSVFWLLSCLLIQVPRGIYVYGRRGGWHFSSFVMSSGLSDTDTTLGGQWKCSLCCGYWDRYLELFTLCYETSLDH